MFRRLVRPESGVAALGELFALCGFAFVQPVLGVLGETPDFFVFRGAAPVDILAFVGIVAAVPPLFLWGVEWIGGFLWPSFRQQLHASLLAALAILVTCSVVRAITPLRGFWFLMAVGLVAGLLALVVSRFRRASHLWLRSAVAAPIVFVILFLIVSPSGDLISPEGEAEQARPHTARSPLVMIVFDELPLMSLLNQEGELDARLFPNFAALAQDSIFFRNATTVAARTPFAIPAIVTAQFPTRSVAPAASVYPRSLFTLLSRSHEAHIFEAITALCPRTICNPSRGLAPADTGLEALLSDGARVWLRAVSFNRYDADPAKLWLKEEMAGERRTGTPINDPSDPWFLADRMRQNQPARFRDFLASMDGSGLPLHFLHLVLPHSPWEYLPNGARYEDVRFGYLQLEERTGESWPATFDHQRHLLQVAYVDRLLGEVLDRLHEVELYERSTVVVVADHGISFTTGPGHSERNFDEVTAAEVAWVPFLLKLPEQQKGEVRDDNVMTVDVLPTVAEAVGVDLSWKTDGLSVLTSGRDDDRKVIYNHPGNPIHFQASRWLPKVLTGTTDRLLRPAEGIEGMFKVGPFADLVGAPVSSQTVLPPEGGRVSVDGLEKLRRVDPDAKTLPAILSGHVDVPGRRSDILGVAVALNGTIAGSSELFKEGNTPRKFASTLLPSLFHPGQDRLEIYLIVGDPQQPSLLPAMVRTEGFP